MKETTTITDFKDLRKIIGEVTTKKPAKTRYQQQAEKMGYTKDPKVVVNERFTPDKIRGFERVIDFYVQFRGGRGDRITSPENKKEPKICLTFFLTSPTATSSIVSNTDFFGFNL